MKSNRYILETALRPCGYKSLLSFFIFSIHAAEFRGVLLRYRTTHLFLVPPLCLFLAKDPRVSNYDLSSIQVGSTSTTENKLAWPELIPALSFVLHIRLSRHDSTKANEQLVLKNSQKLCTSNKLAVPPKRLKNSHTNISSAKMKFSRNEEIDVWILHINDNLCYPCSSIDVLTSEFFTCFSGILEILKF